MKKYISLLFLMLAIFSILVLSSCSEKIGKGYIYTIDDGGVTVRQYLGFKQHVVIPNEIDGYPVRYVGQQAFQRKLIRSVVIPEGVTEIHGGAFEFCIRLASVKLPSSLTFIGTSAFSGCTSLESIYIPQNVTEIGMSAFNNCSSLKNINFPSKLTTIGMWAFSDCDSLENIPLPNGIKNIESYIFKDCDKIVINIWENGGYYPSADNPYFALYGMVDGDCESFKIHPDTKIICGDALKKAGSVKELIIPEGVISICDYGLNNCCYIETITLPASLEFISDLAAFPHRNSSLKEIIVAEGSKHFKTVDGALLSADGKNLIKYPAKSERTELIMPEGVEYIYADAFYEAANLTSITFPDSLIEIGSWAFSDCISLKEINWGNGLKIIGTQAFFDCDSLERVVIPDSVEILDGFSACDNLREVVIGKGVVRIQRGTFAESYNLESIVFLDPYGWYGSVMFSRVKDIDLTDSHKNVEIVTTELGAYWLLKRTE